MKKLFIWLLIVAFAVSMVFMGIGCKKTEEVAAPAEKEEAVGEKEEAPIEKEGIFSKPTELVFWWWGEEDAPGFSKYIDVMATEYNKIHPNITVTPVLQSTADTVPAFIAAAEAQSGPDIATVWYGMYNLETAIWPGYAVPLNDYISEEELSHWIGRKLESYNGKVWASDLYAYATLILYNKDHFRDAGLDPETPPKTWDNFMDYSEKLKDAGHAPFAAGFKGGWMFPVLGYFIYPQYLTLDEMKQAVVGEISFADPIFQDAWQKIDDYSRAGYFIESASSIDLAEAYQEWRKGSGTFAEVSSQQAMAWLEELGSEHVGVMYWPEMTENPVDWVPVCKVSEFITSWSPNKELAADFLTFLHSDLSFQKMQEIHPYSVPADDRFDVSTVTDSVKQEIFEMIYSGYKNEKFFIDSVIPYPIMGDGMIPGGQGLIIQTVSPEEAAGMTEDAAVTWRELNPEALEKYKVWTNE